MSHRVSSEEKKQMESTVMMQQDFMILAAKPTTKKKATDEVFFDQLMEWSELKHQMLLQYLAVAAHILGGSNRLFYIDGFAGQGVYGSGDTAKDGSPVRAAKLAVELAESGKPYTFTCINVEANEECFEQLQRSTAPFGDLVVNLQGTFVDNIDQILAITRGGAVICFLDPFGVKGMDWVAVEKLITNNRKVDFWLRLDHSTVRRQHGIRNLRLLSKVYGIEDLDVLNGQLAAPTPEERREKLLNLYETQLVNAFAKMRRQGYAHHYLIRSLAGENKYHMVFACGHYRGAIVASEIVYKVEAKYQDRVKELVPAKPQARQGHLPGFVADNNDPKQFDLMEDLSDSIYEKCAGKKLSRDQVYIQIWDDWFGKMGSRHVTQALKYMAADGRIEDHDGSFSKPKDWFQFAEQY
jgi:three-Cys-motif partner protein